MSTAHYAVDGRIAVITLDNPPVNALGASVRQGVFSGLQKAEADQGIDAVVITGAGKIFTGGADITEFGKPPVRPALPELIAFIEAFPKPVVAAINGVGFGGGLELPLGCHGRIASTAASLALPEVKLGLLPGGGGTQRLPRLIAPADAFNFMLSGDPITAAKALDLGIVDAVVAPDALIGAAKDMAAHMAAAKDLRQVRNLSDKQTPAAREAFEAQAKAANAKLGMLDNTQSLIETVRATFDLPFDQGLALEREWFVKLMSGDQSRAMRYVFFAERETAKVPGIDKDTPRRDIKTAAVIGGGTMGGGIAMCFVNAGIPVTLIETSEDFLAKGVARISDIYEMSVKRGSLTAEARDKRMNLITGKVGLEGAADADVVVEAVFEEMGIKKDIFATLDRICKPDAILATNTSYLDINEIASATKRPQNVLGLHFFSPANVMRLLEIVRASKTAPDVLASALELGKRLKKLSVVSGVCFGFIGNRILSARAFAGERLLRLGALPHEIDKAITDFGFRMGHFAMGDLSGLDIGWRIRKAFGTTAPVADALCEMGRFGQKTGKGFYDYSGDARQGARDSEVERLIQTMAAQSGTTQRNFSQDELIAYLFYPMVNEGARILEEGISARASDIDMVWLNGYGWPAYRGGLMYWADQVGLKTIVASLEAQGAEAGDPRLKPSALLVRLANEGGSFRDFAAQSLTPEVA
jgi:3-hydroxyacyl-CoA dehydrogenase